MPLRASRYGEFAQTQLPLKGLHGDFADAEIVRDYCGVCAHCIAQVRPVLSCEAKRSGAHGSTLFERRKAMNQKMLMATAQPSIVSSMSLVRGFGRPETRGLVFIDEQHTLTPHLVEFRQVVVISIEGMDALVVRHPVGYGQ
jgi:hypothetical protein